MNLEKELQVRIPFASSVLVVRDVSPFGCLRVCRFEIPWTHNYDVAFAYPDSAFHFSSDAAEPFGAVLTFNLNAVESEQFCNYT
jgi:hypothetical protein